jgi:hypothetical protein
VTYSGGTNKVFTWKIHGWYGGPNPLVGGYLLGHIFRHVACYRFFSLTVIAAY